MKVLLNPKQFLERFHVPVALLSPCGTTPVRSTVWLETDNSALGRLHARNHESELSVVVPLIKVIEPGNAELPAKEFAQWLRETRTGAASLELSQSVAPQGAGRIQEIRLHALGKETVFPLLAAQSFSKPKLGAFQWSVGLRAWRLNRLINQSLFAADVDSQRYALGGCLVVHEEGCLSFTATDGHRLAHAYEPVSLTAGTRSNKTTRKKGSKVVSSRALHVLSDLCGLFPNSELTLGFIAKGVFQASAGEFVLTARELPGRFPPWNGLISDTQTPSVEGLDLNYLCRILTSPRRTEAGDGLVELRIRNRKLIVSQIDRGIVTVNPACGEITAAAEGKFAVIRRPDIMSVCLTTNGPASLSFPQGEGQTLRFESEGFRYLVMPMDRDEAQESCAHQATDEPPRQPSEGPPAEEAQSVDVTSLGEHAHGTHAEKAPSRRDRRRKGQRPSGEGHSPSKHTRKHLGKPHQ